MHCVLVREVERKNERASSAGVAAQLDNFGLANKFGELHEKAFESERKVAADSNYKTPRQSLSSVIYQNEPKTKVG